MKLYTGPRYEIHEDGANILHYDGLRDRNHKDHIAKRSPKYCGSPAERLSQKEEKLLHFVAQITGTKTKLRSLPTAKCG